MFSSLWGKGNKGSGDQNRDGDAGRSIFENDENEIKQNAQSPPNSVIPSPEHYPLHAAVLQKDAKSLLKHLGALPATDPLLPDKMKPINQRDHHGFTALHLCVYLAWEQGLDLLLENGASPTVRSRSGWTAVQEAISLSQRDLLRKLFRRNLEEVREGVALRSPIIRRKLRETDDFYVEIDWKFTSWIPFVSRFCPCDTFKIWKRGSDFRLDMTLVDFEAYSWKRGHISFIFVMDEETDTAAFYVLNHDERSKQMTNKEKEMEENRNEEESELSIEQLLQSELVSPEILTERIEITKSRTMFGYERSAEINGKKCTLYELKNLIVFANKKDSHCPQEVKEQRAATKKLFHQKMDAAKNGDIVDLDDWQCTECRHRNGALSTLCEHCDAAKAQRIEEVEVDAILNGDDGDDDEQKSERSGRSGRNGSRSVSSIKALFGDIKKYQYPEYVPPAIALGDYFDAEQWKRKRMDALSERANGRKKKATTAVMEDRRESFPINPAQCSMTTKAFKLNLAMTEHFGLSVEEILAILEAAAPQSKLAAKLKQFLEIKMPRGFPIQLEMPLFHVLKATVTFQHFEHINPDDDLFAIPEDYVFVEEKRKKK